MPRMIFDITQSERDRLEELRVRLVLPSLASTLRYVIMNFGRAQMRFGEEGPGWPGLKQEGWTEPQRVEPPAADDLGPGVTFGPVVPAPGSRLKGGKGKGR